SLRPYAWADTEPWRSLEDDAHLARLGRHALAGADEEGHAAPAPVVDLQLDRGEGLRGRVGGDVLDIEEALVLAAHVALRVRRARRLEEFELLVADRVV